MQMNPKIHYLSLDKAQRESYAKHVGTSTDYLQNAYFGAHVRKIARGERLNLLVEAGKGAFSKNELLDFFHNMNEEPIKDLRPDIFEPE